MTTTDEFKVIIVARFTSSDWERSELKSETQFPRMCSFALQYFPSLGIVLEQSHSVAEGYTGINTYG